MGVVGATVILGLIVAVLVKMKVARVSVTIVCVLFGLVLGASPVGDLVFRTVADVGSWTAGVVKGL